MHIIRNMCARAVLHLESMEITEDAGRTKGQTIHQEHVVVSIAAITDNGSVYQMPRPATTTLPYHSSILFYDFLFESDTIEDGQKNIRELLEIETSIEHVDDGWERALEIGEMEQVRAPGVVPDHLPLVTSLQEKKSNFMFWLIIIISIIVGLISWLVYKLKSE